jgi:glycosylphosphatidylinositol transamidase (GPIT) subunit GPI8
MKMPRILLTVWLYIVLTFCMLSCSSDESTPAEATLPVPERVTETMVNVDVVLPSDIRKLWQPTIDLAEANIAKAQLRLKHQVKLNLRYHDEHSEDLEELGYALTHPQEGDDTCHAIIGPYHSSNAMKLLKHAHANRLPVVMPSCTGADLQRINARNTYAWFLTESDITQCEIMLAAGRSLGYKEAILVYSDDSYGKSFADWFAYYATEQQMELPPMPAIAYQKGLNLEPFFTQAAQIDKGDVLLCIAVSEPDDIQDVLEQAYDFSYWPDPNSSRSIGLYRICSDTSLDEKIIDNPRNSERFQYGISPVCNRSYGFWHYINHVYKRSPYVGEAQMYDAMTMIAMGAAHQQKHGERCIVNGEQVSYKEKPYGPGLTDHMRAVISNTTATPTSWTYEGLALAFDCLSQGQEIDVSGASSSLVFDHETHTKILNTPYMLWELTEKTDTVTGGTYNLMTPMLFLSTGGSNAEASTMALWEHQQQYYQDFSDVSVSHELPTLTDRWAVVVSPSTSWENYRHQADAFAMYQTLRRHGYDDDHIVLIVEDNLATDPRNTMPGQIFVERPLTHGTATETGLQGDASVLENDDVRHSAVVDYHFSDLQPDDLLAIMTGQQSQHLPHVIHPTASSNVFFFWSGHGRSEEGPLWGNEDSREYFGTERIKDIVTQMAGTASADNSQFSTLRSARSDASLAKNSQLKKYRRMMLTIETCYSGHWGLALEGLPDVLVLTAATPYESSKADIYDGTLGVYLSNAFARTFRRQIDNDCDISIYDLYRELARTTPGSHVSIYNQAEFGSVYTETMREFFE